MRLLNDDPSKALDPASDVHLMAEIFNAGAASRRVFSEVHYIVPNDPNLTIGMGHFVEHNIAELFARFRSDDPTWTYLLDVWSGAMDATRWQAMQADTGVEGTGPAALEQALDRVLCVSGPSSACVTSHLVPWSRRVRDGFNSGEHWFTSGWKAVCRAEPVARGQVLQWQAAVLESGCDEANRRGLETRGGIACVISAKSSGIGTTMFPVGAKTVERASSGVHRRWSLIDVPQGAWPKEKVDESRLLDDWRSVVAWQFYTLSKGRVRSRMRAIWDAFFEPSWGALAGASLSEATQMPRHTGTLMDATPFDMTIVFVQPVGGPAA